MKNFHKILIAFLLLSVGVFAIPIDKSSGCQINNDFTFHDIGDIDLSMIIVVDKENVLLDKTFTGYNKINQNSNCNANYKYVAVIERNEVIIK